MNRGLKGRVLVVAVTTLTLSLVSSGAMAEPPDNLEPARRQCEAFGGRFITQEQAGTQHYFCEPGPESFTEGEVRAARNLCEGHYRGSFLQPGSYEYGNAYRCSFEESA